MSTHRFRFQKLHYKMMRRSAREADGIHPARAGLKSSISPTGWFQLAASVED